MSDHRFLIALQRGMENLKSFDGAIAEIRAEVEKLDVALREMTDGEVTAGFDTVDRHDQRRAVIFCNTMGGSRAVFEVVLSEAGYPVEVYVVTKDRRSEGLMVVKSFLSCANIAAVQEAFCAHLRTSTVGHIIARLVEDAIESELQRP